MIKDMTEEEASTEILKILKKCNPITSTNVCSALFASIIASLPTLIGQDMSKKEVEDAIERAEYLFCKMISTAREKLIKELK